MTSSARGAKGLVDRTGRAAPSGAELQPQMGCPAPCEDGQGERTRRGADRIPSWQGTVDLVGGAMAKPRIFLGSSGKQAKLVQGFDAGREESLTLSRGPRPSTPASARSTAWSSSPARSISPPSSSPRTTGRAPSPAPSTPRQPLARPPPRTTWCSRPDCSGEPRHAANLHPACQRRQAADRPAGPNVRPVRRR